MKVTVVTATVGNPLLEKCLRSVANQTHKDIQHLLVIDGPEHHKKLQKGEICKAIEQLESDGHLNVIAMPYSIGKDRWNGHRIYAAGAFQAEGDFLIYLDDDNSLEPTHIEDCLKVIEAGNDWAYSFRNIMDKDHKFLCKDECESLGKWASVLNPNDFFIDVNCYFIPKKIAIHLGPAWYRKFREPNMPEVDRVLAHTLMNNNLKFDTTYKHTVNYTVGNTQNSVQPEFFEKGNAEMRRRFPNGLPWKVQELPLE
jgi:glycosyltransferase involved in cell wall biosynthesis